MSQSLIPSSNLRLYLRDSGVKPEALLGGCRIWLVEPRLKAAARRTRGVRQWTRVRADLIYKVCQTRSSRVSEGDIALRLAGLRLQRGMGVTTVTSGRRARRNPTRSGGLRRRIPITRRRWGVPERPKGAERHPEPTEAEELERSLTAPTPEP